ncbi:MAG: hypothetical protein Q8R04_01800, partial [Nanoarchaeota archaeon]|nr:hypothetical protein [Nanoarchaeota archaeon]
MVDKTETINLEELLNSLDSDQGRVTAIGNLLHINAIDIPLKFVDFAIHYYEKAGLFKDAAKVANEAKIAEKAKELYAMAIEQRKKKDDFFGAGHIAEEAGNLFFFHADKLADKSRMDKPAKSAYKSDLNEIAKQFYLVAIENYKKEGVTCSNSAAELAKRIGGATKKIEVYEDMHQYEDAIRAAEEANMNYKAIEISL